MEAEKRRTEAAKNRKLKQEELAIKRQVATETRKIIQEVKKELAAEKKQQAEEKKKRELAMKKLVAEEKNKQAA
jgi:hypothetical protein